MTEEQIKMLLTCAHSAATSLVAVSNDLSAIAKDQARLYQLLRVREERENPRMQCSACGSRAIERASHG